MQITYEYITCTKHSIDKKKKFFLISRKLVICKFSGEHLLPQLNCELSGGPAIIYLMYLYFIYLFNVVCIVPWGSP